MAKGILQCASGRAIIKEETPSFPQEALGIMNALTQQEAAGNLLSCNVINEHTNLHHA